jgi:2-isopropylmalate synthase
MEAEGYQFEAAEASFELIVRKVIGRHRAFFELDHYRVAVHRSGSGRPVTKATLTLKVDGKEVNASAEGDGPVNALDNALRAALLKHYPSLETLRLVDYKVRVVNSTAATAARVRVMIEFRSPHGAVAVGGDNGPEAHGLLGTVGVSENIIDASWQALVDGVEYHLLHEGESAGR